MDFKVNDIVKVKVIDYWFRGIIQSIDGEEATVKVPTFYGYAPAIIVTDNVNNLKEAK